MASPPQQRTRRIYLTPSTAIGPDLEASQSPSDLSEAAQCPDDVPRTFYQAIQPFLQQRYEEVKLQKTVQTLLRIAHTKHKQNPEGECPGEVSKYIWTTVKDYAAEDDLLDHCAGYVRSSHQHWSCFQDLNGQLPASQDALSISGPTSVSNYFSRPQITFSTETDFYGCSKSSDSQLFGSDLCESSDTAQPILEENDVRQNHPLFETTPDALSPQLVSMGKGKTPVSRMRLGNGHLSRDPSEGLLEFQGTGVALGINLQTNQTPHTAATQDAIGDNAVVAVNSRKDSPKLNARKFKCHWCGRVVGGLPNIKMHLSACDVLGIQQTWVCLTHPKSPPYHQKHLYQKHHFNYHHAECGVDKATDCPHAENVLQDLAASKLAYGCGVCRAYVKPGELVDHLKQHYKEAHGRDEGWIPWTYNDAFRGLLKQPLPWTENQASGVRSRPWTIQSLINKHARQAGYTDESFDDFVWVEETSSELYEDLQCNARGTSEEFIDQLAYNIYWHMVSSLLHYNRNPTDNAQLDYSTHLSPANAHVSDDFW